MTELEKLYRTYFEDVYLYILSLSKNRHIAEDITSEAFIKAIESIDTFRGTCDIRVWLCQIAKNCYFSYLRKNKKFTFTDKELKNVTEFNIDHLIISKENSMKVHEILHKLKNPYKEVFSLRVFSELSFKQIGSLFGKTDNWACVTYHRARKKIQEEMEVYL
ncbi:RNA polymerase sigma factor, sigma-70 family [[Clostridium] ultunense Esp]|uniref:RNA polymerase sigma factor, sigma-70 family n=1 Tax=[Clostridium] ultunense Esp TaxID=1288971 RepID=M1ZH30_9FIRM|nr:sigma-70 family RNA polymerase sigma factor [Schnuerera ultunensis]MCF6463794.1 sigma-70 family RNA polymerase sigma factor [Clostridium sp. Cult1]CCQ93132.1 RNA polymerase sigma factor, sigma-70 family [[Clostridium] ultunense Esp]SHD76779.1 RNA polymerase sigma factor, sigma-70 family [[Clostridium] ultunense Esp]